MGTINKYITTLTVAVCPLVTGLNDLDSVSDLMSDSVFFLPTETYIPGKEFQIYFHFIFEFAIYRFVFR